MAENSSDVTVISLGNNFGKAVVEGAGIKVELDSDGHVTLYRDGSIVYPNGDVNAPADVRPVIEDCFPVLDDIVAEPKIGELIEGKGVYVGEWKPKDKNGNSLGKVFNLYAAPEDLTDKSGETVFLTFDNTVKRVAALKKWHGHDGGNFENRKEVLQAVLDNPRALENWFIPTREILDGKDEKGNKVQTDNLFDYRDRMSGGSEFITTDDNQDDIFSCWYWSCTEHPDELSEVYSVKFMDGANVWDNRDNYKQSLRPVRAELRL